MWPDFSDPSANDKRSAASRALLSNRLLRSPYAQTCSTGQQFIPVRFRMRAMPEAEQLADR